MATPEEWRFLKQAGVLSPGATSGLLISVGTAITACRKARVAAPMLAALEGIPELQPHTGPLPLSQPLQRQQQPPVRPSEFHGDMPNFPNPL